MYLLDTNALSELLKKRPKPQFLTRLRRHPPEMFFTSSICVMELRHGSRRRGRCAHWRDRSGPGVYGRDGECTPFRAYTSSPGRKLVGLATLNPLLEKRLDSLLVFVRMGWNS